MPKALTRDDALAIADGIVALINSQPRTPTRDQIVLTFLDRLVDAQYDAAMRYIENREAAIKLRQFGFEWRDGKWDVPPMPPEGIKAAMRDVRLWAELIAPRGNPPLREICICGGGMSHEKGPHCDRDVYGATAGCVCPRCENARRRTLNSPLTAEAYAAAAGRFVSQWTSLCPCDVCTGFRERARRGAEGIQRSLAATMAAWRNSMRYCVPHGEWYKVDGSDCGCAACRKEVAPYVVDEPDVRSDLLRFMKMVIAIQPWCKACRKAKATCDEECFVPGVGQR